MNKMDHSALGTNGIPSKPPGTVYFHKNRDWKPSRLQELHLPLGKNIDALDILSDESCFIHLINCNESECRGFISVVLETWKNLSDDKKTAMRYYHHRVYFYFCALDRDCFNLLSKFPRCNYEVRLAYGTRIVSFRDSQDLVECFTTLKLWNATQDYFPPEPTDIQNFLKGKDVDTKWMDARYGVQERHENRASKPTTAKNQDGSGKSQKMEIYPVNDAEILQRSIELRFDSFVLESDVLSVNTDASQAQSRFQFGIGNNITYLSSSDVLSVNTDASQAQSRFQLGIGNNKTHLSSFLAIAIQVPTLRELKSFGGDSKATGDEIVNALKDRPVASSSCSLLDIIVDHAPERHHTLNFFWATYKLLNVFHEKKLSSMSICVEDEVDQRFMQAAVESILKSAYIRKLVIYISYPNDETIPEICDFLSDLTGLCSRLPRGFYTDVKFNDEFEWIDPLWRRAVNGEISRFEHTMDEIDSAEFCILTDFVSTKFVNSRMQSPIRVLPVDIFRKLREFLTSGPKPYSPGFEDSPESEVSDESEDEVDFYYGFLGNDDDEDDENDDYYEW